MTQDNETPETGEPIAPLADLEQEVSARFISTVRNKIYRRTAANQMVAFSWNLPKVVLLELVMLIGHMLKGLSGERAKS